jgi:MFS family permease
MHTVLLRVALFFLQSVAVLALLPLVARGLPGGDARSYTLLLACLGVGAIFAALLLPRLRRRMSLDRVVRDGTLLQAAATLVVAFAPSVAIAAAAMIAAGAAWLAVANTLSVSAQLSLPDWVRARGMSIYQMALMGGSAAGAALWGQVAGLTDLRTSLVLAAASGALALPLVRRFKLAATAEEDLTPAHDLAPPVPGRPLDPEAGPVLVTIEYRIDRRAAPNSARSCRRRGAAACATARWRGSCSATRPTPTATSSTSSTRPGSSTCAASTA